MKKYLFLVLFLASSIAIAEEAKKEENDQDYSKITNLIINQSLREAAADKQQGSRTCDVTKKETLDLDEAVIVRYYSKFIESKLKELKENNFQHDRTDLDNEILAQLNECTEKNWFGYLKQLQNDKYYQLDSGTRCRIILEKSSFGSSSGNAHCFCETVVPAECYESMKKAYQDRQAQKQKK